MALTLRRYILSILLVFISSTNLFGLTVQELKAEIPELVSLIHAPIKHKKLTFEQWDEKIKYRGVHTKFDKQLNYLEQFYPQKISRLQEMSLDDILSDDNKLFLQTKISRLKDKFAAVVAEIDFRERGLVTRTPHGTSYYIDYVNGDDARTGLNPNTTGDGSWKTITKYTTTTVRTPGDVAYLRANITWLQGTEAVDIIFDEDGTIDDYIKIIGCDASVNDPWTDSSDVKPIIDFENLVYNVNINADNYWWLERLDFRQSNDGVGAVYCQAYGCYFKDCNFQDNHTASGGGFRASYTFGEVTLDGCSFLNTNGPGIYVLFRTVATLINCTFTAGVDVGSTYGCRTDGALIYATDCTFSGSFGTKDLNIVQVSSFYGRNITFAGSPGYSALTGSSIFLEDEDGTFESQVSVFVNGTITRGTTSPRAGGADSFAIMAPTSQCGPNFPLVLGDKLSGFARVWVATNAASTITIYVRVDSAWDSALTAAECYIKASYLSDGANANRVELQSTELITNNTNWTALTITIPASNPKRDGWVYVWFYLEEFEDATEKVDVDIKPVIS